MLCLLHTCCDPLHGSVLAGCPIEFPMILRDSLEVLFLNDNQLECVPQSVCGLHSLTELYLSKWVLLSACQPSPARCPFQSSCHTDDIGVKFRSPDLYFISSLLLLTNDVWEEQCRDTAIIEYDFSVGGTLVSVSVKDKNGKHKSLWILEILSIHLPRFTVGPYLLAFYRYSQSC